MIKAPPGMSAWWILLMTVCRSRGEINWSEKILVTDEHFGI
jgi:hypothetical protein